MAIAIEFDKAKAQRFLDALEKGKPIHGAESVQEMLMLAGACFFTAMGQGPELQKAVDWSKLNRKRNEDQDTFIADLHAAIEYYAQLTMLLAAGEYDQSFESRHYAIVLVEHGKKTVVPVSGMHDELEPDSV